MLDLQTGFEWLRVFPGICTDTVKREISRDLHAPGLPVLHILRLSPAIPNTYKHFLYDVSGFLFIAQKPQGKAVKLVLYR